jgi:hypothetical protein
MVTISLCMLCNSHYDNSNNTRTYLGANETYYVGYNNSEDNTAAHVKLFTLLKPLSGSAILQSACGYYNIVYLTGTRQIFSDHQTATNYTAREISWVTKRISKR